jgi:4-amino-4-deoxy-L-arabinose transferase-like glycosyltransferase
MDKKIVLTALFLIIILGAFLRLYQLDSLPPGLYPDEAMNGNNGLQALANNDFKIFYPENNGREGLFINLQAFSIKIFGNTPYALRLVSALFGTLTIFAVYLLTKELFRDTRHGPKADAIALIAAFFLATSFWHINFSRIGFRAITAPFFIAFASYFLLHIFRTDISSRKKTIAMALGGLSFGAGFHSYISYRLAPLLLIVPLMFINKLKPETVREKKECSRCLFALFIFFAILAVLPLGFYFLEHQSDFVGRAGQVSVFASEHPFKLTGINILKSATMFFWHGDANPRHNFAGKPEILFPLSFFFGLGLVMTAKWLLRSQNPKEKFAALFLLFWLILFLIPMILSSEGVPHALRAIMVLPSAMIVGAFGFYGLFDKILTWLEKQKDLSPDQAPKISRIKKEITILAAVFLIFVAGQSFNLYFLKFAVSPETASAFSENYLLIGKWLNTLPKDVFKYVIINANGVPVKTPDGKEYYPMPSQTAMFITDTWSEKNQKDKNIYYYLSKDIENISCPAKCFIVLLENDAALREKIKTEIPDLKITIEPGFPALIK